jgi:hypothetical protein
MFEVMLFLSAPAAISRLLKRDFVVPVLFLTWAHLALTAQRNIPFFMIVMAPCVALWIEETVAAFRRVPERDSPGDPSCDTPAVAGEVTEEDRVPGIPVLSLLVMVLVFVLFQAPGSPPKFRPQFNQEVYPEEALAAVNQMGLSTRMFTTDVWGGFLVYRLYPDVRVFWDSRADFYGASYSLDALGALLGRPGWDKTLAKNRITAVLVPLEQPLASLLAQSRDWHVVYRGKIAILYQLISPGKAS